MTQAYYDDYDFEPSDLTANPYETYTGEEDHTEDVNPWLCARCDVEYRPSNIPNMLRCPKCGDYIEEIEAEDDGGAWDRSSRHKTRLDLEDDE